VRRSEGRAAIGPGSRAPMRTHTNTSTAGVYLLHSRNPRRRVVVGSRGSTKRASERLWRVASKPLRCLREIQNSTDGTAVLRGVI
jgi:hypothetical protein